ncbi:MAG TPA: cupin domain-containing protein [Acidimicrobiales bacterium]|nr:cupin domain-containing protein [Acidimicrobiales bacterium]
MDVRRVVTGHDATGRAVVTSDEIVEPITADLSPAWEWHRLWGVDGRPGFPDDGAAPGAHAYFPPSVGHRFGFFTVPPNDRARLPADLDLEAALAQFEERLPGLASHVEPDGAGMHTTATIDYGVVLAGEVTLELDDGVRVSLRAGDTYVQNGTRHRWTNEGDEPAVIAVVLIGADHAKVG